MEVKRFLTVGDLIKELKDVPSGTKVRYSRRKPNNLYTSEPLHDICFSNGVVLLTTYYTDKGTLKQKENNLDDFL